MRPTFAGSALAILVLAGCTTAPDDRADAPGGLDRFHTQRIAWTACPDRFGLDCGSLTVPLDYAEPEGETVTLALYRIPADGARVAGSLVVGPGGPGDSGADYLSGGPGRQVFADIAGDHHVVSYDARGIGATMPFHCESVDELIARMSLDATPDSSAEETAFLGALEDRAAACKEELGDALGLVGTRETVRDLDVLRAALGEDTLTFLGISYGTLVGSQYAGEFTARVGRLALDGALPARAYTDPDWATRGAAAMEEAFDKALATCFENEFLACPLGDTAAAARASVEVLLRNLDEQPAQTASTGSFTRERAVGVIANMLAVGPSGWRDMTRSLGRAEAGSWVDLMALEPSPRDMPTPDAGTAIRCADLGPPVRGLAEVRRLADTLAAEHPIFGATYAWRDLDCAGWPLGPTLQASGDVVAGAGPILVVTSAGDPVTPATQAEAMAEQLDGAPVLTYDGPEHVAYWNSDCARYAIRDFITEGVLPEPLTCGELPQG